MTTFSRSTPPTHTEAAVDRCSTSHVTSLSRRYNCYWVNSAKVVIKKTGTDTCIVLTAYPYGTGSGGVPLYDVPAAIKAMG